MSSLTVLNKRFRGLRERLTAAKQPFYDQYELTGNEASEQRWTELLRLLEVLRVSLQKTKHSSDRYVASEALGAVDDYINDWLGFLGTQAPVSAPERDLDEDVEHATKVRGKDFAPIPSAAEIGYAHLYRDDRLAARPFADLLREFDPLLEELGTHLVDRIEQ